MDADLSLEVSEPSLGGGRRQKIQEEGSDMNLKNFPRHAPPDTSSHVFKAIMNNRISQTVVRRV